MLVLKCFSVLIIKVTCDFVLLSLSATINFYTDRWSLYFYFVVLNINTLLLSCDYNLR